VWAPYRKGDIGPTEALEKLGKVQKRATKMLPALKNLPYSKRIKACTGNLSTLHYTCIRGDKVAYKIITGKYDPLVSGASIPMGQGGHVPPPNIWTWGGDMITNVPPIFLE